MSLATRYQLEPVSQGDTAELKAALNEDGVPLSQESIASVTFAVQKPNNTVIRNLSGEVLEDGRGYYRWTDTTEPGEYLAQAQFTLTTGEKRSVIVNFAVYDPFDLTPKTLEEIVIDDVWVRLEDCFDSIEGGPWLRDTTMAYFDKRKIGKYIPETLVDINVQMPLSNCPINEFAEPKSNGEPNELLSLLSQGVLCRTIMHLIRSYIEIPVPQGAQIVYEDRTRYKDAWKAVYETEHTDWYTKIRLWKRGMLRLGHSKMIVLSKAGRLYYGTSMRTRNIGRFGGFY